MLKVCYNCKNYGKCNVQVRTCKDFTKWNSNSVSLNIGSFDIEWKKNNKRWYDFLNEKIIWERDTINGYFLKSESISQFIENLANKQYNISIEKEEEGDIFIEKAKVKLNEV